MILRSSNSTVCHTKSLLLLCLCFMNTGHTAPAPEGFLDGVKKILFYGDSLTDGSSYPDYVVNTLRKIHPEAEYEIFNAAIAGDTAANLRARLEADVLSLNPDLVIIGIGTNDALGKPDLYQYREDMTFIIRKIQAQNGKVFLILPSPFADEKREARLQEFLQVLRELAAEFQLPVADVHGLFLEWQKEGRQVLGPDGIHHGPDGFACKARAVVDALGFPDEPLETTIQAWPGLLLEWETSAPIPASTAEPDPSLATDWRPYDREALSESLPWSEAPFPARGAWMPFGGRSNDQIAFGRTFFDAPEDGVWRLEVGGSQKPLAVWINGTKVWESTRRHGYHPNADRFPVELKKGKNEIIVVSNYMTFLGLYQ